MSVWAYVLCVFGSVLGGGMEVWYPVWVVMGLWRAVLVLIPCNDLDECYSGFLFLCPFCR